MKIEPDTHSHKKYCQRVFNILLFHLISNYDFHCFMEKQPQKEGQKFLGYPINLMNKPFEDAYIIVAVLCLNFHGKGLFLKVSIKNK